MADKETLAINGKPCNKKSGWVSRAFMMLKAEANPTSKTSVVVEYYLTIKHLVRKVIPKTSLIYRLLNFKGKHQFNFGTFTLQLVVESTGQTIPAMICCGTTNTARICLKDGLANYREKLLVGMFQYEENTMVDKPLG
jgi:hypothetical protein